MGFSSARNLGRDISAGFSPPRRMPISEAVKKFMRVPKGAGNSVPWDPELTPYIIEPMNCLASREYDAVIFVGPARTGKTIGLIDGWIVYTIVCDPSDMLVVQMAGTNEFIGEGDAYIPPHTGLPANSTDIAPPDIPAGFVAVFNSDESSWHLVEDHRGKTVYDVASGDALFISELGPLPENVTWLSPEGEFQKWNGTAWVKDTEAEKLFRIREAEETKNNLMQVASEHIAPLQDAADLEIATEEEISLLEAWKKYRVLLNRVDTSTAQDIEWPALP